MHGRWSVVFGFAAHTAEMQLVPLLIVLRTHPRTNGHRTQTNKLARKTNSYAPPAKNSSGCCPRRTKNNLHSQRLLRRSGQEWAELITAQKKEKIPAE
jgi:hypothetical protein